MNSLGSDYERMMSPPQMQKEVLKTAAPQWNKGLYTAAKIWHISLDKQMHYFKISKTMPILVYCAKPHNAYMQKEFLFADTNRWQQSTARIFYKKI